MCKYNKRIWADFIVENLDTICMLARNEVLNNWVSDICVAPNMRDAGPRAPFWSELENVHYCPELYSLEGIIEYSITVMDYELDIRARMPWCTCGAEKCNHDECKHTEWCGSRLSYRLETILGMCDMQNLPTDDDMIYIAEALAEDCLRDAIYRIGTVQDRAHYLQKNAAKKILHKSQNIIDDIKDELLNTDWKPDMVIAGNDDDYFGLSWVIRTAQARPNVKVTIWSKIDQDGPLADINVYLPRSCNLVTILD